jgi:prepilin-type N-terminal cleavage/methylation domain-containing protein
MKNRLVTPRGFSLVELAVVLVLVGIVMTMGLKAVTATLENAAYAETRAKLERLKTALIVFLRTNGRLPCPDNSGGLASGIEASTCIANAGEGYGIVPWVTLGIERDAALDGWGNFITYRVANGHPAGKNWTSKTTGTPFDINELKTPTNALTIQEVNSAGSALQSVSTKAVAVFLSHGANGYGAKTTKVGARMPYGDAGAGEQTNASNLTFFIKRPVSDAAGAFNGPYDDLVVFLTPDMLLQPLVDDGTIKSCTAYCPLTVSCSITGSPTCNLFGVPAPTPPACNGGSVYCPAPLNPACASGSPVCLPPSTGCVPATTANIPIGKSPVSCL